ncbi:MAG: hypothetical protein ACFCUE_13990 [Candidatus Bathyarchaeia archaeon]|jgi:hypothetical protein
MFNGNIPDSEILLNRCELEKMLQKARLEGARGYITYLCQALDEKKISTLEALDKAVRVDWGCACSAVGQLMMENLLFDGYANGLMANIKPEKKEDILKTSSNRG